MSLFKFGDLEAEIDFTDVLFLENLEDAKQAMKEEAARVPKTGKTADIIRAQCQCYFNFFDRIIGEGAHEEMFQGKISLNAYAASIPLSTGSSKSGLKYPFPSDRFKIDPSRLA